MTKPSMDPEMNAAIVRLLRDHYPVSKASADYAAARIEELEAECVELLTDVFLAHSYRQPSGPLQGWYDSQSNTDALLAGNRLVELGVWKRRPNAYGKRQWYRRVEQEDT